MNYIFIGWYKKDNSDKVWGVIELHKNAYVTFWGRRGKKLQTKIIKTTTIFDPYGTYGSIDPYGGGYHYGDYVINDLIKKKEDKGYSKINKSKLDTVYPEFESDLEKTAFWAGLQM